MKSTESTAFSWEKSKHVYIIIFVVFGLFLLLFERVLVKSMDKSMLEKAGFGDRLYLSLVIDHAQNPVQLGTADSRTEKILPHIDNEEDNKKCVWYKVKSAPEITGKDVETFEGGFDEIGAFLIKASLTPAGKQLFADSTKKHVGEQLAIIFDGKVISAPTIQSSITVGKFQITGKSLEKPLFKVAGGKMVPLLEAMRIPLDAQPSPSGAEK
ncbi:MAG: hypothetical protein HQM10_11275 [Candidatus Riflebacteria bacterium]|nr:hypothetical protein [Candidatus Riflebacteria bacterium]